MKITIGGKIKALRNNKGITQEQLAGFINVSFQTVSKWERDETLPDIALLPVIAGFFDVTVDELLGYSREKNEHLVTECINGYKRLVNQAKFDEAKSLMIKARKDFPSDFRIMAYYMPVSEDTAEIDGIYKRICDFCFDDEIRIKAKEHYCGVRIKLGCGASEELLEAAGHFRHNYSRDFIYPNLLDAEASIPVLREMLHSYCMGIAGCAKMLCDRRGGLNTKDKVELLSKASAVYELIYDEGDMFEYNGMYISLCEAIGRGYLELGEADKAVTCFEKCVNAAAAYDAAKTGDVRSSAFFRGEIYDKGGVSSFLGNQTIKDRSLREIYRKIFSGEDFDSMKSNEGFTEMIKRLTAL